MLVNDFSSVVGTKFEESKHYLDNTFGALGKAGLNIIHVPYSPVNEVGEDDMLAALGIYINYLETKKYVFLPQFGGEFEEKLPVAGATAPQAQSRSNVYQKQSAGRICQRHSGGC